MYKAVSPDQILMVSDTLNAFLFAACMKEKHFTPSCFEIVIHTKVIPDEDSAFLSSIAQDLVTLQIHSSVLSRNPLDIFLKRCRVSHHKPGTSAFYRTSCATLTLVRGLVSFCAKVGTFMEKRNREDENERQTMKSLDSLVRATQKGDAEVFTRIVERFQDMACAAPMRCLRTRIWPKMSRKKRFSRPISNGEAARTNRVCELVSAYHPQAR